MLSITVKGNAHKVNHFLYELSQLMELKLIPEEVEVTDAEEREVTCDVQHQPASKLSVVRLQDRSGCEIAIPMLDLVCAELEDGKYVLTGRCYDLFS
ncbi:hypothetical protein ADL26_01210 [Thermoactinomyces vulgaris]|jgi:hypothetical protein|uniref:Uncharacterized protein n=1 Tax=Laceyella sediminis TaxID=573074 RepID=A0ABX5ET43_9BACL|nr:hypothetical protein [Laceyella sediminis]KPC77862.1 hypothetical protein ADL26_01210 [Thermoactinomyces vulgaris]PRZ15884.1 hypothetical protein CLV36_103109 [Laceyella sediminis]